MGANSTGMSVIRSVPLAVPTTIVPFICVPVCSSPAVLNVTLDQPSYLACESDRTLQVCVNLSGEMDGMIEVLLFTSSMSPAVTGDGRDIALEEVDYGSLSSFLVFMSSGSQCQNVDLIEDQQIENEEVFAVSIESNDSSVNILVQSSIVLLKDSDGEFWPIQTKNS